MDNQVPENVKTQRADIIKKISKNKYKEFIKKNIGSIHEVLIEKHRDKHSGNLKGVTRNYLTVQIVSENENLYNTLQNAKITDYKDDIIYAQISS